MAFALSLFELGIGTGCGGGQTPTPEPFEMARPGVTLDAAKLDSAIEMTADYILRHTLESGRFEYLVKTSGKKRRGKYNVLRHAGTIYALAEYRAHRIRGTSADAKTDERVDSAIQRSARYLADNYLGSFEAPRGLGPADAIAVWSRLGEEIRGDRRAAKLGGAGLGLVALSAAHTADPELVAVETLRGLARTIASMQKPDGHFVSKVIEGQGADPDFVSLYYPGEAVLGLTRLYRIDPDRRWIEIAGKAIEALVRKRESVPDDELPADHWLLIATGELAALAKEDPDIRSALPMTTAAMVEHAIRIADAMIAEQRRAGAGGSFHPERRSTPTATRLEGILAIIAVLDKSHAARPRLIAAARAGTQFLIGCQVRGGPSTRIGGIPRSCVEAPRGRQGEIRIDYAQHALSAFVGANRMGL